MARQIAELSVDILSQMIRAKERSRQAYKESIERVLTNISMLLDVHRPRSFDSADLQTEIPGDVAFYFCYNMYEANASETGKILIRDIKASNSPIGLS